MWSSHIAYVHALHTHMCTIWKEILHFKWPTKALIKHIWVHVGLSLSLHVCASYTHVDNMERDFVLQMAHVCAYKVHVGLSHRLHVCASYTHVENMERAFALQMADMSAYKTHMGLCMP